MVEIHGNLESKDIVFKYCYFYILV